MIKEDLEQILSLTEEFLQLKINNEHKLNCIDYILSKFRSTIVEKKPIEPKNTSSESFKFFLMAVEDARIRTEFYNKVHRDLDRCIASESNMVTYMNNKLNLMRKLGYDSVPEDIPLRQLRYPMKQDYSNSYYFR